MNYDRTVPRETITEMVRRIEPTWRVREATPAAEGHHVVYHLDVEAETETGTGTGTGTGHGRYVLKATPPEKSPTCDDEARLLAILDSHTSLPVPDVLGVVDEADRLPAPFFLSSTLPGKSYDPTAMTELSATAVERLAGSTGRHLARLHGLDAVDAYGFVEVDADDRLDGERPGTDVEQIAVRNPVRSWVDYLASEVERATTELETTRFGDLAPTVRRTLRARIDDLSGEFEPVVARIDHSLDNVLLDSETGAVTGLLDWEFSITATPAYDLAFVEHTLSGGHWTLLERVPDHRETVRSAMLDGYRRVGSSRVVAQFRKNRRCYALFARLHEMINFDGWFDQVGVVDVTDEQRERAADRLREDIAGLC